jgi:hypothetical protein
VNQKLHQLLTQLRLKGMARALDHEIQRAEREAAPVSEVLSRLLIEEQAYRQDQSLRYRLKRARIPWDWTLKTFPFDKQPGVSKAQIQELAGLAFVERKENVVLIGNPADTAFQALRRAVSEVSLPNRIVLALTPGEALPSEHPAAGKGLVEGKPAAYVCDGPVCSLPIVAPQQLVDALAALR